jgi:hypothetical protein
MLLRVSGQVTGAQVDMRAVNGEVREGGGVEHAAELVAFTEAVMDGDDGALAEARSALRAVLSPEAFVDACAVIGAFNVVDRIADSTGIPLDTPMASMTRDLRAELDLSRFRSSDNTPAR